MQSSHAKTLLLRFPCLNLWFQECENDGSIAFSPQRNAWVLKGPKRKVGFNTSKGYQRRFQRRFKISHQPQLQPATKKQPTNQQTRNSDKQETRNSQQPTTSKKQPTTNNNQQPTRSNQPPTRNSQSLGSLWARCV